MEENKIYKHVCSVAQMKVLEQLGVDIKKYSTLCWVSQHIDFKEKQLKVLGEPEVDTFNYVCPAMIFTDIMSLLPQTLGGLADLKILKIDSKSIKYVQVCDSCNSFKTVVNMPIYDGNMTQAAYAMLKWCVKSKYVELD